MGDADFLPSFQVESCLKGIFVYFWWNKDVIISTAVQKLNRKEKLVLSVTKNYLAIVLRCKVSSIICILVWRLGNLAIPKTRRLISR